MEFNGFSDEDIVKGFLASLYEKKKTRQAILESVLDSEVSKSIVLHVYKSIQGKKMLVGSVLCPWSVYFCRLIIIWNIEFYIEEE